MTMINILGLPLSVVPINMYTQVLIWIMNIAFAIVLIRFLISIVDLVKEKIGYNETTL